MFLPAAVRDGEWWRVFTHPFIHVTWFQGKCFLPFGISGWWAIRWRQLTPAGLREVWQHGCSSDVLTLSSARSADDQVAAQVSKPAGASIFVCQACSRRPAD